MLSDSKPYSTTNVMTESVLCSVSEPYSMTYSPRIPDKKLLTKSKPFRATRVVQLIPKQMTQMSQFFLYNQKQAHLLVWQWNFSKRPSKAIVFSSNAVSLALLASLLLFLGRGGQLYSISVIKDRHPQHPYTLQTTFTTLNANRCNFSLDFDSQEQFPKPFDPALFVHLYSFRLFLIVQFQQTGLELNLLLTVKRVFICGVCDMCCMTCTYIRPSSCSLVID